VSKQVRGIDHDGDLAKTFKGSLFPHLLYMCCCVISITFMDRIYSYHFSFTIITTAASTTKVEIKILQGSSATKNA